MRESFYNSPAAKILSVLSGVARLRQATLSQLVQTVGLAPSTAHRIASELERLGYLHRVPGTREWTVSAPLVTVAAEVLGAAAAFARPQAVLRELAERTGEMTTFVVQSGNQALYIASAEPQQELMLSFCAGRRAPLYCTSSGRIFLSRMSEKDLSNYLGVERLVQLTPYTVTDPDALRGIVARIREQRFAITKKEYIRQVIGAAVPVVDRRDVLYGTLGISGPEERLSVERLNELIPTVAEAAARLTDCFAPIPADLAPSPDQR